MKAKRLHWKELRSNLPINHLVFLNENSVNLGMIHGDGRAVGGKRVVDHASFTRPRATTLLSAIRANKVIAQAIQVEQLSQCFSSICRKLCFPN